MKQGIYQTLVEPVIEALKKGYVPWHHTPKPYWGFARNYATDIEYTGINWILLNLINPTWRQSPWYLTEHQIQELGGTIKKNPQIILVYEQGQNEPYLQPVFNSQSVSGIDFTLPVYPPDEWDGEEAYCNMLLNRMNRLSGFTLIREEDGPSSNDLGDAIDTPFRDWWCDYDGMIYDDLYIKAIHWTGHENRMGRTAIVQKFNTNSFDFSQEHLVGEIGAAYLCMSVGLNRYPFIARKSDYTLQWIHQLETNPRILVDAAEQAASAVQFLCTQPSPNI